MADEPIRSGPKLDPFTPPSDASPYIRTFAKDVAKLTNIQVQSTASAASAAPVATPSLEQGTGAAPSQTVDSVTLPEFDASPVNRPDSAPKEFAQETVELKKEDSEDIFQQPARAADPAFVPASFTTPTTPLTSVETERESALARLRAKLAQRTAEVKKADQQAITELPAQSPTPPVPTTAPESLPAPLPAPLSTPPQKIAEPSPIHTYTTDFADRIDQKQATTFSVLAAQSDAQTTQVITTPRTRVRIGAIVAAAAGGIAGVALLVGTFVFISQQAEDQSMQPVGVPSLVRYDERVEVAGTGLELQRAVATAAGSVTLPGNVVVVYSTQGVLGTTTASVPDGAALVRALELPAPAILLRNIGSESTVGIVHAGGEAHPFMVLQVASYERTFAGMLAWEPRIREDLNVWYPLHQAQQATLSLEATSTSTAPAQPQSEGNVAVPFFVDVVVSNYDARALRDASGRTLMVYGYRGKNLLVIARNEAAFTAVMGRLAASGN